MFRFHVVGLCLGVLQTDVLKVLMLNSSARSRKAVPHHLPGLFVPGQGVAGYTASRLPSISGRWLPSRTDADTVGWDLTGVRVQIGAGTAPGRPPDATAQTGTNHPTGDPLDWSSLTWVLNASKFLPGGALRHRFKHLGEDTIAIVEFKGGALEGGQPVGAGDTHHIWRVRPGYEQAFTSTLDIVYDEPPSVNMTDVDGRPRGGISLASSSECWIVNEAPERARQMEGQQRENGLPANEDCVLYLEAFDAPEGNKALVDVKAVKAFKTTGQIFSTVHCDMMLVEEEEK